MQVIDASDVRAVIDKLPAAKAFLHALYDSQYAAFFPAFLDVVEALEADLYLSDHGKHYMYEARVVAYVQYLTSYKSVTIPAMAQAFGVSEGFIDNEVRCPPPPKWSMCAVARCTSPSGLLLCDWYLLGFTSIWFGVL